MSRYEKNSFSKAQEIINNLSDGITHADPELNKKLMNAQYKKEGCFYLELKVSNFNTKQRIVGDAGVGLAALAKITADIFKTSPVPKEGLEAYFDIIEKYMEDDDEIK